MIFHNSLLCTGKLLSCPKTVVQYKEQRSTIIDGKTYHCESRANHRNFTCQSSCEKPLECGNSTCPSTTTLQCSLVQTVKSRKFNCIAEDGSNFKTLRFDVNVEQGCSCTVSGYSYDTLSIDNVWLHFRSSILIFSVVQYDYKLFIYFYQSFFTLVKHFFVHNKLLLDIIIWKSGACNCDSYSTNNALHICHKLKITSSNKRWCVISYYMSVSESESSPYETSDDLNFFTSVGDVLWDLLMPSRAIKNTNYNYL